MDFAGETMGVEEELLLVDPESGTTVPAAGALHAAVTAGHLPPGATVQRELLDSQIEAATGICATAAELRDHLVAGRRVLADAAHATGVLAVPMGTAPLPRNPAIRPTGADRYARIDALYAEVTRDYEACGLHVHVGVADRDTAVAVVGHVNRWLPTLLALSVNSPFHDGRDTGYGSWRIVQQSRFPGSGLAPHAADHQGFAARIARLVDCGALADESQTFWFARPSPHLPTVEFRVADTAVTVSDAVLQALLARALVRTARADLARGRQADPVPTELAQVAVWSAARYGPSGPGVDLARATTKPATELVRDLLAHVRDALADTGDLDLVRELLRRHVDGARRQRALAPSVGVAGVPRQLALESRVNPADAGTPRMNQEVT
jgi:carboxylate-amine ligase